MLESKQIKSLINDFENSVVDISKIENLISEMILSSNRSNVIDMSIPKDVRQFSDKCKKEIIDILNSTSCLLENKHQIINNLRKSISINDRLKQYITNRAREELSVERHDDVYQQLNKVINGSLEKENKDLNTKDWAETWLMIVELQEFLD